MNDIITCKRRTGVDAVLALLGDAADEHILVLGDPQLAQEISRRFSTATVRSGERAEPGWTIVQADYEPPTFWQRLLGRAA